MRYIFALLALLALLPQTHAQTPSFVKDSLDSYINREMKQWNLPGLAIVIVKDGHIVTMKGFGIRDLESRAPVNEHTLFMIASNTKLFTGTSLSLLQYRNRLSLNDKITKYFPHYRLYDATATEMLTIRDLLSHRIGTKTFEGDFTFWNSKLSREEVMERMQLLKPFQLFRQDYGYCNSCFLTAGQVIPVVTGQPWEAFVHDSILHPLEMNETRTLSTDIDKQPNAAKPYTTSYTGTLKRVPFDNWNNLAPAASIISNVSDLSHWLLFQLDSGRYNGRQVLPWQVLRTTRDMNTIVQSRKSSSLPVHYAGYGLGVFMNDYNGYQVYYHTGGAGGMVSNVCFVPEAHLGIAILTNNDNQILFEALRYQILDAYLGVPYKNRSQQFLAGFQKEMEGQLNEISQWKHRMKGQTPELPMEAYTGVYNNKLYGDITVSRKGKGLQVNFSTKPDLSATLDYMDNGEWLMQYNNILYGIFSIRFAVLNGKVMSVTTKQNEFVEYDPYTFDKIK